MGEDHPIAWCHNYDGGRSWQTALGHREATVARDGFRQHILGGIEWTAGITSGGGDCVTFYEVDTLVEEAAANGGLLTKLAAHVVANRLDAAEADADAGDHHKAVRRLVVAKLLADHVLRSDHLADKIGDLIEWQQGLD